MKAKEILIRSKLDKFGFDFIKFSLISGLVVAKSKEGFLRSRHFYFSVSDILNLDPVKDELVEANLYTFEAV